LKDHLISPFTTGYEGTAIESLYPSNTDIFRFAREQGAIGAYVHPFGGPVTGAQLRDPLETNLGTAKAFPVDVALETITYHELWSTASEVSLMVWHHALNNGFKVPVTGGEDSISSLHRTALVGAMRGYFWLGPGKLSWENYKNALVRGNGFVTNGPLLQLTVTKTLPGGEIRAPYGLSNARVHGTITSLVPLDRAEIILNGKVAVKIPPLEERSAKGGKFWERSFEYDIMIERSSWVTLQVFGNPHSHPVEDGRPMATTNPVYITLGGYPIRNKESADYFVRWIDKLTAMAEAHQGWRSEKEKSHVLGQFREAREIYVRRGQEAR
jgi:hypothetical protein